MGLEPKVANSNSKNYATITLLKDRKPEGFRGGRANVKSARQIRNFRRIKSQDLKELESQFNLIPNFPNVEIQMSGDTTVVAVVPARNTRERELLKSAIKQNIKGWHTINKSSYRLPRRL